MCGLFFIQFKDDICQRSVEAFGAALATMSYRGPDHIGTLCYKKTLFGHVRLSIIDLSERSHQPLQDETGILLFTGEIYNYRHLDGHAVSDTWAIKRLLRTKRFNPAHLQGMYAILHHDIEEQTTTIWRDFYGEKPLYYYQDNDIIMASSTIRSMVCFLKHAWQKQLTINPNAIYNYLLSGYVREPETIYQGIKMLPPAGQLKITNHKLTVECNHSNYLAQAYEDDHLINCMQSTDVLPTLLLSSGIDSTYLLHHLAQHRKHFSAFTYQSDQKHQDESELAVRHYQLINKNKSMPVVLSNTENVYELVQEFPGLLEQPSSDGLNLHHLLRASRTMSSTLKLILMGTGGDELFGGYPSFKNYPKFIALRMMKYFQHVLPKKFQRFCLLSDINASANLYYFLYRACPDIVTWLPQPILLELYQQFEKEMAGFYADDTRDSHLKRAETFDYMRNQLLRDADTISLHNSYEARNPLLDIASFHKKIDYKCHMANTLKNHYGIHFKSKRGFTFDDGSLRHVVTRDCLHLNDIYGLFDVECIKALSFKTIHKIYNLYRWFIAHDISAQQLSGVYLK